MMYWFIAVLSGYGDVLKRYVAGDMALSMLYALAAVVPLVLVLRRRGVPYPLEGRNARLIEVSVVTLITVYLLNLLTSLDVPFGSALSHALYLVVPLSYVLVLQRFRPDFDFERLAQVFLVVMLPINIIGFVQYVFNPNFLISTAYSGDMGGAIRRNLLLGGAFVRYPSIFASADRYSAIALMQFYFAWLLLRAPKPGARLQLVWILYNLMTSLAALGISGARARIFLALVMGAFCIVGHLWPRRAGRRGVWVLRLSALLLPAIVVVILLRDSIQRESYPIIAFLQQTVLQRDVEVRVEQALASTLIPENMSLFGSGLGSIGAGGKPGEFGIQSIWIESGAIWGTLLIIGFGGICWALLRQVAIESRQRGPLHAALAALPLLVIVSALLVGLTAAFELSSGILLSCAIAYAVRRESSSTRHDPVDHPFRWPAGRYR